MASIHYGCYKIKSKARNQQFLQSVTIPCLMLLCRDYTLERNPPSHKYILQLAGHDAIIYYLTWQNDKSTPTLFCQLLHKHLFQLNYSQTVLFPQRATEESSYSGRVLSACNA